MSKLTKILAGVALAASFGAWSGSHAYADLQYVVTQVSDPSYPNGGTTLYTNFTLTVKDTTPGVTSAAFYDGIGAIQATGFTNNPFWGINFSMQNGFALSSGSIFPTGQWSTDTSSQPFQNPHPLTGLDTELIQFHSPGGGAGAGVAIPTEGLLLANFSVYYSDNSVAPTVAWTPNSYSNSLVSNVWTEDGAGKTDKNGGTVSSIFVYDPVVNGLHVTTSNTPYNIDHATLSTFATQAITVDATTALILTEDAGATRQSPDIVNEIDGAQLTLNGTFDVTNHDLIVHNSTADAVLALIVSGFNGGGWDGTSGIITSTGARDGLVLYIATAADLGLGGSTWDGVTVSDPDVLVKYTYYGDANLDGQVTLDDYPLVDGYLGASGPGTYLGDLNLDGQVTLDDYPLIDGYLGSGEGNPLANNPSAVPEPASISLLVLGAGLLLKRRR